MTRSSILDTYPSSLRIIILTDVQSPLADILPEYDRHEFPAIPASCPGARASVIMSFCTLALHTRCVCGGVCPQRRFSGLSSRLPLNVSVLFYSQGQSTCLLPGQPFCTLCQQQTAFLLELSQSQLLQHQHRATLVLLMGDFNAWVAIRPDVEDQLAASLQALGLPVHEDALTVDLGAVADTCSRFGSSGPCFDHWLPAWRQSCSPCASACSLGFSD